MKKLILFLLLLIPIASAVSPNWVNDPNSCPSLDAGVFPGQDCTPEDICGEDSGIAKCFDTSTISAPTVNTTTTSNADDGSFDGGYLINCYATADATAPFCYDSSSPTCDKNSTVHSTLFRDTICLGTDSGGGFGITRPGSCRTNYFQCDGGGSIDDCEILSGQSCGSSTGTIQLDECFSSSAGNCTASGNNKDCDNNDLDDNINTCNNATDGGCEINLFVSTNNSNSEYQSCTTFECVGAGTLNGWLDCDSGAGDPDGGLGLDANGCEVQNNSACTIGGLSGTISMCSGGSGSCVVDDVDYGTSGQEQKWSSIYPFLWFTQLGSGLIANFTGTNGDYWLLDNDGNTEQSGNITLGDRLTFVAGVVIETFINLIIINSDFQVIGNINATNYTLNGTTIFDWTEAGGGSVSDGNASSICSDGEYLDGSGSCIDFNSTVRGISLNQTEGNSLYVNVDGDTMTGNLDLGDNNLSAKKVSLDELAFPNASFKAIVTNDLVNGTAYGVYMDGQTGTNKPTFWIQPGGPGQASGIARTFLIVNEIDALQSTTNITSCSAWADEAGEILQIDCNTTTSGADLIVGDDIQIFGDMWLKDSDGEWHFLTRELTIIDELLSNTMSNLLDVSVVGNTIVLNDTTGDTFTVVIGKNYTILTQSNDLVALNIGTDLDPQFNYVSYKNAANPTLTADTSEPAGDKVHVASVLVGSSGSNLYGFVDRFSHDDKFIQGVYHRFFDMGTLYNSGFLPALNTSTINISSGTFDIMLDEYTTTLIRDSAADGFFFINSSGQFIQATSLSEITQYSDGTNIGSNKMVNLVWGIVPINLTEVRIMVVIQDFPGGGNEYVNIDLAEADKFNKLNMFPSDDFLKKIFVPVARTVFRSTTNEFQTLTNGDLLLDLRGTAGGLGGSPPSPSITDHGDLDGLTDDDHTQYLLANGSRNLTGDWQTGEFDINGTGDSRVYGANQTMFDKLITNFNSWITNSVSNLVNYFIKSQVTSMIDGNRTESESNLRADINSNFTELDNRKLNTTDQRYNNTDLALSINTTANIQALGFQNGSEINASIDARITVIGNLTITENLNITNDSSSGLIYHNGTCLIIENGDTQIALCD